jgi:hypothetical protein
VQKADFFDFSQKNTRFLELAMASFAALLIIIAVALNQLLDSRAFASCVPCQKMQQYTLDDMPLTQQLFRDSLQPEHLLFDFETSPIS